MNINPTISEFVKHQFPDFYQEEGENFIAFVETYYKWLEQEGGVVKQIRDIPEITDIDKTPEAFLENFKETYMSEFPSEILGNQRLLQKHILELYRSKGSDAGLALLFRLLFNTEVTKYIPSYDIFKASDGIWVEPMYIEVTDSPLLHNFSQRVLYGQDSKSSAICERIEYKNVNDKNICQIYVSNLRGNFKIGEKIYYEGMDINSSPYVIGSIRSATPVFSSIGFDVGEIITTSSEDTAKPVKGVVIDTQPANGIVDFLLVDGGHAYSKGANISVTYGTATTGTGAIFVIDRLKDTFLFKYHSDSISPYLSTAINATSYGFPKLASANLASIIDTSLIFDMVELGTIDRIRTTNRGVNYNGTVNVSVIEPISVGTYLDGGDDAVVIGSASLGDGYVNQVKIIDSGFGNYRFNEWYTFQSEEFSYKTVTCKVEGSAVGISEGYFDDTKGFLSEDKFLADGHYYQDFSYVIKSRYTIDDYISVLRKLYHPSGNAVFADILLDSETGVEVVEDEISHSLSTPWLPRGVGNYPPSLHMGVANDKYWYSGNVKSSLSSFKTAAGATFTRSTSKTCFDSNGILVTVPINNEAIDYDPITNIRRGMRLEGAGTNLAYTSNTNNSETFSGGGFGILSYSKTYPSPAGSNNATLITELSGNSEHYVADLTVPVVTAELYVMSCYVKASPFGAQRAVMLRSTVSGDDYSTFNPSTGAWVGSPTSNVVLRGFDVLPNGWYRVWACHQIPSSATKVFRYQLHNTGSDTYDGDGVSGLIIWGRQIEKVTGARGPSSYIPSLTAVTTRSADVFNNGPNIIGNELINPESWILFNAGGGANATNSPLGQINLTGNGTGFSAYADIPFTTEIGVPYRLSYFVNTGSTGYSIGTTQGGIDVVGTTTAGSNITVYREFIATSTTTWVRMFRGSTGTSIHTNITVKKIVPFTEFVQRKGAIIWEGDVTNVGNNVQQTLFDLSFNAQNRITVFVGITGNIGVYLANFASILVNSQFGGGPSSATKFRAMLLFDGTRMELWMNGILKYSSTSLSGLPAIAKIHVGRDADSQFPLAGHVSEITYFNDPPWSRANELSIVGAV